MRGLKHCAEEKLQARDDRVTKRERKRREGGGVGESLVFGKVGNTVAGNTLDTATHFRNQAEIIILIDIQLDSLFHISSLCRSRPLSIQIYLRNTFLFMGK